ncbi:aspartate carbamoyltransferase catalytic subunit [Clostridium sp. 'deep sea']|uniref:aspartate carbamoyltransferase catalytic subunit n=1 Tax=Clostridium sp. 'deep sea' TaxID=2779445 RepID=UPI0018966A39|nr:aspartate carbamoyltransferase catalytic subunit [Clostridium sp. 'deep sea']QOR35680.1 aspartate carbamoyltransferase catalytic subunit [Clostridium sp. 'deep sea']
MKSSQSLSDLISIKDLSLSQLTSLLEKTKEYKQFIKGTTRYSTELQGKTIGLLFYEPSTRTKCSFQLACDYLGAHHLSISKSGSSFVKGESLKDTAWNLHAMGVDLVVMRHPVSGAANYLSSKLTIPVVNAGDGMHAHPTQALLDIFTMQEYCGTLKNKTVTIVGDIRHSRVARSNIHALNMLGANVRLVAPKTFLPKGIAKLGVQVFTDIREAVENTDILMALRIQKERQLAGYIPSLGEYAKYFGVNNKNITNIDDYIIMHPGPINRGVEISSQFADSSLSVILKQVPNGVAVRMAILSTLLGGIK